MNRAKMQRISCDTCGRTGRYEVVTASGKRLGRFCADDARFKVEIWNRHEDEKWKDQTTFRDLVDDLM